MKFLSTNKYYYTTVALFIVLGGILLSMVHKADVTIWINSHHNAFSDAVFRTTDYIGALWFSILIIVAIALFKDWKTAIKAAVCFIATAAVVQFLKHIVFPGELRPSLYFEGKYDLRFLEGIIQLETESFPSGHTAAAFSIATLLALLLNKKHWHWALAVCALSAGYARLYLSQHFSTDVYTGMIIGVVVTTFIFYFYPKKFDKPEWAQK